METTDNPTNEMEWRRYMMGELVRELFPALDAMRPNTLITLFYVLSYLYLVANRPGLTNPVWKVYNLLCDMLKIDYCEKYQVLDDIMEGE